MELVTSKIPPSSVEERAKLAADRLKKMSADGITSLMDALVTEAEKDVWLELYNTGRLKMRVRMAIALDDPDDASDETVERLVEASKDIDTNFLRSGMVKAFADGVMEAPMQTAALLEPYLGVDGKPSGRRGNLCFEPDSFARLVRKLDAAGVGVHIHAIGDRAVRASLDAFDAAREANGDKDNRHQIAHLELIDPDDIPRFKTLGVIADMQLLWAQREEATEKALAPYIGPERHRRLYPAGSLHASGAMIIGGSDWDVTSHNPFLAIRAAVTLTG
jgi:predicted amidohydrolase YtcJ